MPSVSKEQQRFFQVIRAVQEGHYKNPPKALKEKAKAISKQDAKDFAIKVVEKQALCYLQHSSNQLGLTNNHMSNPFAQFEKTASDLGFSADQIETIKKEASASFDPQAKEKVAEETTVNNYVEGFMKSAMESGVSFNEAKELLIVANTVKTAEELSSSIKSHFGKNKKANMDEIMKYVSESAKAHPEAAGGIAGALGGGAVGGLMGGGKGAAIGAVGGAGVGAGAGHGYHVGGEMKHEDLQRVLKNISTTEAGGGDASAFAAHAAPTAAGIADENNFQTLIRHLTHGKTPQAK